MTLFMTSYCKNLLQNDVIKTGMKSAGIHLMNYQSFIPTPPFSFLDKSTEPICRLWPYLNDKKKSHIISTDVVRKNIYCAGNILHEIQKDNLKTQRKTYAVFNIYNEII